jgi:tRNA threonylcarbamoyladenosine biosynthesis protein TsaE
MIRRWTSRSEAETEEIGAEIAAALGGEVTLLLIGDLGSGKTVLVRGLAAALGVDRREIQSPTYALIHEHRGARGDLVHVDLYRLEPPEVGGLGLDELLASPGVKAIEWAERLPAPPPDAVRVRLETLPGGDREIVADPWPAPADA